MCRDLYVYVTYLVWFWEFVILGLTVHTLALWGCSDGSLEITPQMLLVDSENNNLERQSDKKATVATFTCVGVGMLQYINYADTYIAIIIAPNF